MRLSVIAPALLLCLLPLGCGGSDPPANDPNQYANNPGQYPQGGQQGQYGQPQAGQYGQPQAGQYGQPQAGQYGQPQTGYGQPQTGYQQPGAQPGYTQPGAQPGLPGQPAAAGGQATPIPMAAMLTPGLQAMAQSEAPGMQPDGQAFAGQFQEGQTLEQPINIQAGKCYAIVGVGTLQQLDILLVAQQAPLPPVTLAQSSGTGPNATLGGKGQCFRNPFPVGGPGKVILKATRGGGVAAAQVFVK